MAAARRNSTLQAVLLEGEEKRQLKKLYRRIEEAGPMHCLPGCTDCCGPIPFSRWEMKRAPKLAEKIEDFGQRMEWEPGELWQFNCGKCPYSVGGNCGVYDRRPFICRIFGMSEDPGLKCPHGCKPEHPLTQQETNKLFDVYRAIREQNAKEGY